MGTHVYMAAMAFQTTLQPVVAGQLRGAYYRFHSEKLSLEVARHVAEIVENHDLEADPTQLHPSSNEVR